MASEMAMTSAPVSVLNFTGTSTLNTTLPAILLCDYLLNMFCTLKCIFRFFWYITCYWVDCFLGLAVRLKISLFCIYDIKWIIKSIILQDNFSRMGRNISTPSTMFCFYMSLILWYGFHLWIRLVPIMLLKLSIVLWINAPGFCVLCSNYAWLCHINLTFLSLMPLKWQNHEYQQSFWFL